jgi:hypothetical protein
VRVCRTVIALLALGLLLPSAATADGPATSTAPATTQASTAPATGPTTGPATTTAVGEPPFAAEWLTITASSSRVWEQGSLAVVEAHGPVHIDLGAAQLSADDAVVWIRPASTPGTGRPVDVVLLGHVSVTLDKVTYDHQRYWIPAVVTGPIKLVGRREAKADEGSPAYRAATALLREQRPAAAAATRAAATRAAPATGPTTEPDVVALPPALPGAGGAPPVAVKLLAYDAPLLERERDEAGNLTIVGTGGVAVQYRSVKGDLLEFTAANMVLFTDLKQTHDATGDAGGAAGDHIVAGYFEGDVRVLTTPSNGAKAEVRLRAQRVYYEFATDRAVMDEVVLHTVDARRGVSVFMRANAMRQLSQGEYKVDGVELTTSAFVTATYGLSAAHAYVYARDSGDPRIGETIAYNASDVTLNAFGLPFFYYPSVGGTMTARGSIFRGVGVEDTNQFGFGLRTDWGLFETLGQPPPQNVDASYRLDYYSYRGPAAGIDATYNGGGVSDLTRDPYNVAGDLHAYGVDDHGTDVLGAARNNEKAPEELRGRVRYEHEQDLGDDLTLQVRASYDSDSNFLPQFFLNEYQNGLPLDESLYVKHQRASELASLGAEWQPNRVVSTGDGEQENRERSHLPDLRYDRVGDSVLADSLTFFSANSAEGEKFVRSRLSLQQQGFYPGDPPVYTVEPGLPAFAYTGDPGSTTYVGDARQEVDLPLHLGVVNIVPYAMARYTVYSQSVVPPAVEPTVRTIPTKVTIGPSQNRLIGAAGVRATTDFWRVDDAVESDLFDLHRIRHVISPEVTVFASGQTVDADRLFVYDPSRDAVTPVKAMQLALRQRWQTKRGGPTRWRSVDFLSLDVYANLYADQPAPLFRDPTDFRSVFLMSEPEYSQPRNTANVDATWRISDTTAVLASAVQNLDYSRLATASIGMAVTRGERLSYFVGTRYIAELNSNVATVEANYQLDRKYSLGASESVDLAQSRNVYYNASIIRRFDTFSASVNVNYDQSDNSKGIGFSLSPNGLARGLGSSQLQQQQAP